VLSWVLAGGLSRRFGRDKAMELVDGVPLVQRTIDTLRAAGLSPVVLARVTRGLSVPERIEPDGPRHPAWGLATVLVDGDAFITPCDLPELDVDTVRRLLDARAIALHQPLLGVWPAERAAAARATALAGGRIRALADGLPVVDVGPLRNLNRPADRA
jgi:molybdenum cofactor guanylyltransferase